MGKRKKHTVRGKRHNQRQAHSIRKVLQKLKPFEIPIEPYIPEELKDSIISMPQHRALNEPLFLPYCKAEEKPLDAQWMPEQEANAIAKRHRLETLHPTTLKQKN